MYHDVASKIGELAGNEYLYFDTAIVVKITPHTHPYPIWGASVSPAGKIYVMDADCNWHELENKAGNNTLIQSMYQRLSIIQKQILKTI